MGVDFAPPKDGLPPALATAPAYCIIRHITVALAPQSKVPVAGLAVVVAKAVTGMRTLVL